MKAFLITLLFCLAVSSQAQRPAYAKMSPMLRQLATAGDHSGKHRLSPARGRQQEVCAFIRITADAEAVLARHGCRSLAHYGSLHVAMIPIGSLTALSLEKNVDRIEARPSGHVLMDSVVSQIRALPAHQAMAPLPQAFTGSGVLMGVMDIGFDLTHPNFYSADTTRYRIRAFWDQLSPDTIGSKLPVGRDYTSREELLGVAHAYDGLKMTHGTHTLGTAAGSGYKSPYRGIAPESDICIVANAVSDDIELIDSADVYKYTFATDALGFKYIFDRADSLGMPCVISFSEGSGQDFWGYDLLYYEMLDSLTGPGHILVASAGNLGRAKSWFCKPVDTHSMGTFLRNTSPEMTVTLKSAEPFAVRLVSYMNTNDTLLIATDDVLQQKDSILTVTHQLANRIIVAQVVAYPSCYVQDEMCYDLRVVTTHDVGNDPRVSLEVMGSEASVEVFRVTGTFVTNTLNSSLNAGECIRNIHSPSSSPGVVCVGSTIRRPGITNYQGKWKEAEKGAMGDRVTFSSVGPTYDGRIKPDVMAPGVNIISSYSSFYLENNPKANDIDWDVEHFDFNGRTYAWNSNSGTSMSTPAVGGAIALWLQARPDLTPADVLGVISRTSRRGDPTLSYPNNYWGWGEIDVYHGLLDVLGLDGIEGISTTPTTARMSISHGRLQVNFGTAPERPVRLRVYDLSGRQLLATGLPAGSSHHEIRLPAQVRGVLAVQIDGPASIAGSQLIRAQ